MISQTWDNNVYHKTFPHTVWVHSRTITNRCTSQLPEAVCPCSVLKFSSMNCTYSRGSVFVISLFVIVIATFKQGEIVIMYML